MSQINIKSISGITSITTPAGVDNVFTVHSNDTTERLRVDQSGNLNIAGIITATSYRGDGSQLTGIVAGLSTISGVVNVANDLDVDGHTNLDNVSIAGVATATSFVGSGANLTNLPAANLTGTLPAISGANLTNLPVPTTITVADESSDTTCNPLFVTTTTGNLAPKTGTNLTFDSAAGHLATGSLFLGTGTNQSKAQDGLIMERSSSDGIVHISAGRTGGNYSGINFYVAGDTGGSGANIKLRHQMIYDGSFRWYDADGTTERLRIDSSGNTQFAGQRHRFDYSNSGGVGPYLSLRNTAGGTGNITGISFGLGTSNADLDSGSDWGEGQIKVYNDSGSYGNMEFNLHTGANRSYMKIVGNGQGYTGAGAGTEGQIGGVAFGNAGIAIDRSWTGQPGIHVFNQNVVGDTDQGTFRFHGWNTSYASYPGRSGSDFGVNVTGDGSGFSSDERKKTGITTITNALNTVAQLRGVSYKFVNSELNPQTHMTMDNGTKLGFVAQEVIPLLPSIVIDAGGEKAVPHENGWCDRYCIDYGSVTALLAEAIKELKIKNEALEARVATLEGS